MTLNADYRIILTRMGYYNYQQGLICRHLLQEGGWNTHLQNCRDFILRSFELVRPEIVTVLGSGWLLDFPLQELAERTGRINLVDIVHPPEVREQVAGIKNAVLLEADISGGVIREVWDKTHDRALFRKRLRNPLLEMPEYSPAYETGMVVSLNLLTQLEALPLIFLKKNAKCDAEYLYHFRRTIQEKHLGFLMKRNSVLITDTEELVTDHDGVVIPESSLLASLPEGELNDEWTWYFELRNQDYYNRKSVFRVSAKLFMNEPG